MNRRLFGMLATIALVATTTVSVSRTAAAAPKGADLAGTIKAGYGVADATWHVGAGAGQYSDKSPDAAEGLATQGEIDPHNHSTSQKNSYGVQSRLTFRTIVVEDAEGDQVAFVKSDNYLAQDALQRRVGQLLEAKGSAISYDEIMHMASHNHFSPYYTTPSWGVWLFQDAFDIRAFEYQARAMAESILKAEADLQPAKMGATEVEHHLFKGMVARRTVTDDGTPAGYPLDFGDFGLPVVRFDTPNGQPIATLINWGMHPEGLEADNLITAEFLAPLERFVERATGGGLVFGQGDVGSAESGPARPYEFPDGIFRQWDNAGHAQVERGAYLLAQDVIAAWNGIGDGDALVPFDSDFDVEAGNAWVPGPYSHPYPSVSNCRSEKTVKGDTGIVITGLPDCDRGPGILYEETDGQAPAIPPDHPFGTELGMVWDLMQAEGVPVPAHYDAPGYTGVEENLRLHLQAFKLGEVILLSCACEAQVDLIRNLETRTDDVENNVWLGYDWTQRLDCVQTDPQDGDWTCSRKEDDPAAPRSTFENPLTFSDAAYDRMIAEVDNDAGVRGGWDAPENAVEANTNPDDEHIDQIWGNFTHEELSPEFGYMLPIGVGHGGDYNGYTVSYREYVSYDHYRKALTAYGPHTADYMNKHLTELAAELNDKPDEPDPIEDADEGRALADEARQVAWTTALGQSAGVMYDAWREALPNDLGPAASTTQPTDIARFDSTTFSWRGGSNAVDNPTVRVQRLGADGEWVEFADQSGEIQTKLKFPEGINGFFSTYAGMQEWIWTANFEAFNAFPAEIGSTPAGTYRFVVDGLIRQDRTDTPYDLESDSFDVRPWDGLAAEDLQFTAEGNVSFVVDTTYPELDEGAAFPYVKEHNRGEADRGELRNEEIQRWCDTCSFRPWARGARLAQAAVTVTGGEEARKVPVECSPVGTEAPNAGLTYECSAALQLSEGEEILIARGDIEDEYGEINGKCFDLDGETECPAEPQPSPTVSPSSTLSLPTGGSGGGGGGGGGTGGGGQQTTTPAPATASPTQPAAAEAERGTATSSITTEVEKTKFGRQFSLSGRVTGDRACNVSSVTISRRRHGSTEFTSVGTAAVGADGTWQYDEIARKNSAYDARPGDSALCDGSSSSAVDVLVKVKVEAGELRCSRFGSVIIGRVSPNKRSSIVKAQRRRNDGWKTVAQDELNRTSRFRFELDRCGRVRVVWPQQDVLNERGAARAI